MQMYAKCNWVTSGRNFFCTLQTNVHLSDTRTAAQYDALAPLHEELLLGNKCAEQANFDKLHVAACTPYNALQAAQLNNSSPADGCHHQLSEEVPSALCMQHFPS